MVTAVQTATIVAKDVIRCSENVPDLNHQLPHPCVRGLLFLQLLRPSLLSLFPQRHLPQLF
jgi:hypothetical protein